MKRLQGLILVSMACCGLTANSIAFGQDRVVACVVQEVLPEHANFFWDRNIGPELGDTITINIGQEVISSFIFDPRPDGISPSVPLHLAGAQLKLKTDYENGSRRFEGRHRGLIRGGEYLGILDLHQSTHSDRATIDFRVVEIRSTTVALNKVLLDCEDID